MGTEKWTPKITVVRICMSLKVERTWVQATQATGNDQIIIHHQVMDDFYWSIICFILWFGKDMK